KCMDFIAQSCKYYIILKEEALGINSNRKGRGMSSIVQGGWIKAKALTTRATTSERRTARNALFTTKSNKE
ncbi:hypothetical protein Tco_1579860, partial [Tanacetum coccineum]